MLQYAFTSSLPVSSATIRRIDAKKWFDASVDACLFVVRLNKGPVSYDAAVYEDLAANEPEYVMGVTDGHLVADMEAYKRSSFIIGASPMKWRQGVKHDAASVMELVTDESGSLRNKFGQQIEIESDYVYPLMKGSDFSQMRKSSAPRRFVILTQRNLKEDPSRLAYDAPLLWKYLCSHYDVFSRRKSSIYKGKPPFAIFGVGDYSFSPYKVAISGLHKNPRFRAIGPMESRPVMLDDTCYLLPCHSAKQAALIAALLNTLPCQDAIDALVFWDAKRPITQHLLQRINLPAAVTHLERHTILSHADIELERLRGARKCDIGDWPANLHDFLVDYSVNTLQHKMRI